MGFLEAIKKRPTLAILCGCALLAGAATAGIAYLLKKKWHQVAEIDMTGVPGLGSWPY